MEQPLIPQLIQDVTFYTDQTKRGKKKVWMKFRTMDKKNSVSSQPIGRQDRQVMKCNNTP